MRVPKQLGFLVLVVVLACSGVVSATRLLETKLNPLGLGSAGAVHGHFGLLVGGTSDDCDAPTNLVGNTLNYRDTTSFDFELQEWRTRSKLPFGRPNEGPRAFHSTVEYDGNLWLYGGSDGHLLSNKFFAYDIGNNSWRHVWTPTEQVAPPGRRAGHSAVAWSHKMIVFGGVRHEADQVSAHLANDVWIWDFATSCWKEQATGGASPPGLAFHTAVVYKEGPEDVGSMWVFGGSDAVINSTLGEGRAANGLWSLDLATWVWTHVAPDVGFAPHLFGHSAVVYGSHMFVYGGITANASTLTPSNDLWRFDFGPAHGWLLLSDHSTNPYKAFHVGLEYGGKLHLFGGLEGNGTTSRAVGIIALDEGDYSVHQVCEPQFTGIDCSLPVCRNDCNGLGTCVAPDLCDCHPGFTGFDCSQSVCDNVLGFDLLTLNRELFWARAQRAATHHLVEVQSLLQQVADRLPEWKMQCGDEAPPPPHAASYMPYITGIARASWEFHQAAVTRLRQTTEVLLSKLLDPDSGDTSLTFAPSTAPTLSPTWPVPQNPWLTEEPHAVPENAHCVGPQCPSYALGARRKSGGFH